MKSLPPILREEDSYAQPHRSVSRPPGRAWDDCFSGPDGTHDLETQTPREVVLKVEGYISEYTVEMLRADGECWFGDKERLVLELSGVWFIDAAAMALLRGWSGELLRVHGTSRFIRMSLERGGVYGGDPQTSHANDRSH